MCRKLERMKKQITCNYWTHGFDNCQYKVNSALFQLSLYTVSNCSVEKSHDIVSFNPQTNEHISEALKLP